MKVFRLTWCKLELNDTTCIQQSLVNYKQQAADDTVTVCWIVIFREEQFKNRIGLGNNVIK